jgi:O-antigen biosynthesis protein WbqP
MLVIAIMVKLTSKDPVFYWSDRVGINNIIFKMPKFRTMRINTPAVATHLLENPNKYLTPIGPFLRKLSLDELPQLWSVLRGDMSFVGPRPALYNQDDLMELRTEMGIHKIIPGITGWAQINGRDDLPIPIKVGYDEYYLKHRSFLFDLKILWLTFYIDAYGITTFSPPLFCCSGPVRMLKL